MKIDINRCKLITIDTNRYHTSKKSVNYQLIIDCIDQSINMYRLILIESGINIINWLPPGKQVSLALT